MQRNTVPIFNTIRYAKLSNLKLEGSTINKNETDIGALTKIADKVELKNIVAKDINVTNQNNDTGGLIGIMTSGDLENVHIINSNVKGTNRVGLIAGYVGTSYIKASSSNGAAVSTGNACGGLLGEVINNTTIENCYSLGNATGDQDVGGLTGILRGSSIKNCFSTVKALGNAGIAGLLGKAENNSIVKNNIALGNQINKYKFDGRTANNQFEGFEGNYEYEENTGISTLTRQNIDFTGKISIATKQNVTNQEFYTNTLGWDIDIWDFTNIGEECIPKLKNADQNEKTPIHKIDTYAIHSADEFINLISAHPDAIFTIENDIDFSGKTYTIGTTIIPAFYGEIRGNNNTIANIYMSCSVSQMYPNNAITWGGFVAKVGNGNLTVKNSAMINKLAKNNNPINKFIATIEEGANVTFENCYQNAEANGILAEDIQDIKTATNEELLTKDFYTNVLKLDENIWNLDNITQKDIKSVDNQIVSFITFCLK